MIRNLVVDEGELFENGKFDSMSIFKGEIDISICIDDGATIEYAERCIEHYNKII